MNSKDKMALKVCKEFKNERKSIKLVEPLILSIKDKLNVPQDKFYNILIAVTEAVNNAIIHGNDCDESKKFKVCLNLTDTKLSISVFDQGGGFRPDKVEDPRTPDNLMKENGRGVFLINELADHVDYYFNEEGTEVSMLFYLSDK